MLPPGFLAHRSRNELPRAADDGVVSLTADRVCAFNRQVLEGLKVEEGVVAGEIRCHSFTVGRYLGAPAEDCGYLLERLCIEYAVQGSVDQLRSQIEVVRGQQWEVAWRDFVYRSFGVNPRAPQARQWQLVLALGGQGGFVPIDELPGLSAQVAAVYARRSSRVLYRDVTELLRRGLVERTPAGVRAMETDVRFPPSKKLAILGRFEGQQLVLVTRFFGPVEQASRDRGGEVGLSLHGIASR